MMNKEEFRTQLKLYLEFYFNKYGNKWELGNQLHYYFRKSTYFDKETMLKREFMGMMEFRRHLIAIGLKEHKCGCGTIGKFKLDK